MKFHGPSKKQHFSPSSRQPHSLSPSQFQSIIILTFDALKFFHHTLLYICYPAINTHYGAALQKIEYDFCTIQSIIVVSNINYTNIYLSTKKYTGQSVYVRDTAVKCIRTIIQVYTHIYRERQTHRYTHANSFYN